MTLPKGSGPCHAGTDRQAQRLALRRGIARSQSTISIRSRASAFGAFESALGRPRTIASRSVRCALSTLRNLRAILVFLENCNWTTKQSYAAHLTITRTDLGSIRVPTHELDGNPEFSGTLAELFPVRTLLRAKADLCPCVWCRRSLVLGVSKTLST